MSDEELLRIAMEHEVGAERAARLASMLRPDVKVGDFQHALTGIMRAALSRARLAAAAPVREPGEGMACGRCGENAYRYGGYLCSCDIEATLP